MTIRDFLNEEELKRYNNCSGDNASEHKRRIIQEAATRSFELLVYILGYRDTGKFHLQQMEEISKVRKIGKYTSRRLWLWARGHFKTSLITEAHSIYLILNNPDIRILLVSNTIGIAEKILSNIKDHFMKNEDFRYFFYEYVPRPNTVGKIEFGTSEYFTVRSRTKRLKEPTMMVAGIGTNLTGLHFDYQKIDDLVTKDSVTNDTQIQASKDYYASLRQLFDNPSMPKEDVIGTIYHFNDLYCELRKSERLEESFIPIKVDGVIQFPERYTEDGIQGLILDLDNPYEFQTQYMLNPINPADAKFKAEWIDYYDIHPDGLAEYILVDPASTQKKRSDYTVIEKWGIDYDGVHYLLDATRDKMTVYQRVDALFSIVKNCTNLKWVKYEVLGGRHGDLEMIRKRQQDEQIFFEIQETKSTTSTKEDRITQRLVAPYHARVIRWPRRLIYRSLYDGQTHDFIEFMKLEYLQFPFSEHDDILDCQAQIFENPSMLIKGRNAVKKTGTKDLTADDWEKFYNKLDKIKQNGLTNEYKLNMLKAKRIKKLISS